MVLTPDVVAEQGMPENALSYDSPIDVIGGPSQIPAAIKDVVGGALQLA